MHSQGIIPLPEAETPFKTILGVSAWSDRQNARMIYLCSILLPFLASVS
jgi:hypothetical protein